MAVAVAQVDEDDAAMVAAAVHPAHQQDRLARVRGAQFPAGMGAAKVAQKIQWNGGFHIDVVSFSAAASLAAISSRVRFSCSPVDMFFSA